MTEYESIQVRGARLACRQAGTGEAIVLVHANLSDIRSWDAIFPLLAKKYHAVAYSRRYAWPNEPIAPMTADPWEEQAEDLVALIEKLDLAPCHIVGNSTGATLALLVARGHPQLVNTLFIEEAPAVTLFLPRFPPTLVDAILLLWFHPRSFLPIMTFGIFTMAASESLFKQDMIDKAVRTFLNGVLRRKNLEKLHPDRFAQAMANAAPLHALLCHGSLPAFNDADARSITKQTYLFTGGDTSNAQKHISARLASLLPRVAAIQFDGMSHFLHEDGPEIIAQAIVEGIELG